MAQTGFEPDIKKAERKIYTTNGFLLLLLTQSVALLLCHVELIQLHISYRLYRTNTDVFIHLLLYFVLLHKTGNLSYILEIRL